ncbi:MAG: nucleotidyl transferase AbiEii/AbiGii toxin family protein [Bacteroidia bacterium]|nr:nucleotidyl transferase AbiEii/AbiGii toxin family protein [Bacteroidia bacterium]
MNETYKKQVVLLIRIMPLVYKIKDFAVHGGTAINLFVKNMPRYSVDIDLTYLPVNRREESIQNINNYLSALKLQIEKAIHGIRVVHKSDVLKLQCTFGGATVKIEVNGIKRGIIGEVEEKELCDKAKNEFKMSCVARIVPFSLLYGGKIAAALGRQHPRDLFDFKYMDIESFDDVKCGFMFYLLGSDKPLLEILQPNSVDQKQALENQFKGMSDVPFEYTDLENTRKELVEQVNQNLTDTDRKFLFSFESGNPEWDKCCAGDLNGFPAIQWKLKNINTLKDVNASKFNEGLEKLRKFLFENSEEINQIDRRCIG